MLSQAHRDILKNNREKIRALALSEMSPSDRLRIWETAESNCQYTYNDGSHCAVGACLSKQEQDLLIEMDRNGGTILALRRLDIDFTEDEFDTLLDFQRIHDACCTRDASERQFWNFNKTLDQMINTGELDKCYSMMHSSAGANYKFHKVGDAWAST